MKKIISLVLCLTLLMSVAQLSAMADITAKSELVKSSVTQTMGASDNSATEPTASEETKETNKTQISSASENVLIVDKNEDKSVESVGAGNTEQNSTVGNGKGTYSNVFKIDAYNTYDSSAKVILLDKTYAPLSKFIEKFSGAGFDYSKYADVRIESRQSGTEKLEDGTEKPIYRYAVLQKHYTAKSDTGLQVDDGYILLVKQGTDQFEYLKSDLVADWRVDTNGSIFDDKTSDYNGDTATFNFESNTVSFSHLDDGVMLGESSFQIDTINPTHIDHIRHANVIAIHPYYYTKTFGTIISFQTVIEKIDFGDDTLSFSDKLSIIRKQGFAFIRVEKRQDKFVALQKAENIGDTTALTDKQVCDFGVQNQDGFFIFARPETYEYNYIRDKLYVEWDDTKGADVLSKGDLMNINEYITPNESGNSLLYYGTGDSAGRWYYYDYSTKTTGAGGDVQKNGGPYAYFNFYINNVNKRDDNKLKNTDIDVADNTNIKFQLFDYSSSINNQLSTLGISEYFNFRGSGGIYNWYYDDDGFTKNHASVERTLDNNYPVLNLTRSADGGTKSDQAGTQATYSSPLPYDTRKNLGYLFGSSFSSTQKKQNDDYVTMYQLDNTLLQKNGNRYTYNSADNAVNLFYDKTTDECSFFVRNYTERTSMTADVNRDYGTQFSDFLPFSYTEGRVKGTMFTKDTQNINKYETYQMDTTADFNQFWFGMRMDFNFVQDKNGMLNNNEKMVFNFSGDDDVWVFIDDVLVLDLGGTHGKVTGSIDFATGKVKQYIDWVGTDGDENGLTGQASNYGENETTHSFPTTIYDCFEKAGKADDQLWKNSSSGNGEKIFSDYSTHKLSFFYLERGAGCANCAIDFALTTVSNDKAVAVTKEAYDSDNNRVSADDETVYEFKVTNSDGTALVENERKYTLGSTVYTLGDDNILKLKNGETALFSYWAETGTYKIVEQAKNYIVKTVSSISGTPVDGDSAGAETVTVKPKDNETKYVNFKNTLKSIDINFKFYNRDPSTGKTADISSKVNTYTKTYLGKEYGDLFVESPEGEQTQFSNMILTAGTYFDAKNKNVLDAYKLFTSQANAESTITSFPNYHKNADGSVKYEKQTYHTDCHGNPQTSGEKWITYKDGNNKEIVVTDNSVDLTNEESAKKSPASVETIDVWLFNHPKQYDVEIHCADENTTYAASGDKYVVTEEPPQTFKAFYNQRLGEIIDNGLVDKESSYLNAYGIKGYVNKAISTASAINNDSLKFSYWSFDKNGKTVASTDIRYNFRIKNKLTLYAVYEANPLSKKGTLGLSVSMNDPDIFMKDETEKIRLSTEINPYNCPDQDTNIQNVAAIYVVDKYANIVMDDTVLSCIKNIVQSKIKDIKKKSHGSAHQGIDLSTLTDDVIKDCDGHTLTLGKGNFYVYYVDAFVKPVDGLSNQVILTNKNRAEFLISFAKDTLKNKRLLTFGAMLYGEDVDSASWIVSDNCVDYAFNENGEAYDPSETVVLTDLANRFDNFIAFIYDKDFYRSKYQNERAEFKTYSDDELYNYFIKTGIKQGDQVSPIFDVKYYLANNKTLNDTYEVLYGENKYIAAYNHFLSCDSTDPKTTKTAEPAYPGDEFDANICSTYGGYLSYDNSNVINESKDTDINKEKWHFVRKTDGSYTISNYDNTLYIDATGNIQNSQEITVSAKSESDSQRWYIYERLPGQYIFKPVANNRCVIDVDNSNSNTKVQNWNYCINPNQMFTLENISHYYNIVNDIDTNATYQIKVTCSDGTEKYLAADNWHGNVHASDTPQNWQFIKRTDGSYKLLNLSFSGNYLNIAGGVDCIQNTPYILIYSNSNGDDPNEGWKIYKDAATDYYYIKANYNIDYAIEILSNDDHLAQLKQFVRNASTQQLKLVKVESTTTR